jgi:predicted dehydrogenase
MSLAFCFPHLAANNFRYRPELGGGAFLDHACYLVKALDVYADGTWTILGGCLDHAQYAVDITGAAQLRRDEDGLVANLNWGFGHSYINEMQVIGERRRMQVESAFTKPAARSCDIILEDAAGKQSTLPVTREDPYGRMIEGFIEQYADPAGWHGIRQDILRHAERYFALRSRLQHYQTVPAFAGRTED